MRYIPQINLIFFNLTWFSSILDTLLDTLDCNDVGVGRGKTHIFRSIKLEIKTSFSNLPYSRFSRRKEKLS